MQMTGLALKRGKLQAKERLIVALDVSSKAEAIRLIELLKDEVGMFKIGLELFTSCGTELFAVAKQHNAKVFFDGKFHDIPNTISGACRAAVGHGVELFNLHAIGGSAMMKAASDAVKQAHGDSKAPRPALIAVTILTSMDARTLRDELKVELPLDQMVPYLAKLAQDAGLDGVVASALEAQSIRKVVGEDFLIVTPGIRPAFASTDDQSRIVTPAQAISNGADYIVVGRPILKHASPVEAARLVVAELA